MKRGKKPKITTGESGRLRRRAIAVVLTLVAVAAVVGAIVYLGDAARREIGPRDRYSVSFMDIECDAPPGFDRARFLNEVRYAGGAADTFQSLDPELHAKLAAAFTAHPWVAAFEGVSVDASGTVRVKLKFRTPALDLKTAGGARVVDSTGVLLPVETRAEGLPVLVTPVPVPTAHNGEVWNDPTVRRAVELVETHHPRKLEKTPQGWRLTMPDGKTLVVER